MIIKKLLEFTLTNGNYDSIVKLDQKLILE
jgi:hypothetical protein